MTAFVIFIWALGGELGLKESPPYGNPPPTTQASLEQPLGGSP